ncbi:ABC transporter permease [Fusibacter sp. 3D3]|uniref:ABC transporter permease n=1 Tax=Fusibacter sp. 3D3 TaxID=1048380 RepID=UPI000853447C|nr:ABC transporter permease [Fusibacter sp. 3D3]GAU76670.1 oligopeptide transport system permease protein OppB [Fusibacter sp. 3D3]
MLKYTIKRIFLFIPTVLIISFVIFFIIQLPEGDFVSSYVARMQAEGEVFTAQDVADLRTQYGIDQPWLVQYFNWMEKIITKGDFGYSFAYARPVWSVIMDRLVLTIIVSLTILIFTYLVSIPIGLYSALHQYSVGDYFFTALGFLGMATPNFLLAIILMYVSFKWTGDPLLGLFSTEMLQEGVHLYNFGEFLQRMIIPTIVIGTAGTAGIIRTVRGQMLDEQTKQYTLTARAKGLPEYVIVYKYCLRAVLNPVASGLAKALSNIFSGSTISAIVMNLSIQGPVLYAALKSQDMYLAGTILLVQAVLVVIGTLLSDLALAWLDPRIRFDRKG